MSTIRSVGVLSFGKVSGLSGVLLGAIFGVIYGGILMLIGIAGSAAGHENALGLGAIGVGGGLAVMIGVPIFYGVFSFVFGLLYAVILNLVLRIAGGVEVEIE